MSRAVPWAPLCGQPKNTTSETQDIPDLLPEETELDDNSLQQFYFNRNLDYSDPRPFVRFFCPLLEPTGEGIEG